MPGAEGAPGPGPGPGPGPVPAPGGPLTAEQERDFFELGYLVLRGLLAAEEVAEVAAAFDRLKARAAALELTGTDLTPAGDEKVMCEGSQFVLHAAGRPGGAPAIRRVVWAGACEPVLSKWGVDRRFLAIARQVLKCGDKAEHLICQAHYKEPGDGTWFPAHQDSTHRGHGHSAEWEDVNGLGSFVQVLLAVDAATDANGPLIVLPRSCEQGHLGLDYSELMQTVDARLEPYLGDQVPLLMEPGDVALLSPYIVHSSEPNRGGGPRRVFINGYAAPGANRKLYPGHEAGAGRRVALPP